MVFPRQLSLGGVCFLIDKIIVYVRGVLHLLRPTVRQAAIPPQYYYSTATTRNVLIRATTMPTHAVTIQIIMVDNSVHTQNYWLEKYIITAEHHRHSGAAACFTIKDQGGRLVKANFIKM